MCLSFLVGPGQAGFYMIKGGNVIRNIYCELLDTTIALEVEDWQQMTATCTLPKIYISLDVCQVHFDRLESLAECSHKWYGRRLAWCWFV